MLTKLKEIFFDKNQDESFDLAEVYYFVLRTTWLTTFSFCIILFAIEAWFSFTVVLVGTTVVLPYCMYLAKRGNPLTGRFIYLVTSNLYILLGSMGCNHLIGAEAFFISLSFTSVLLFRTNQTIVSWLCLLLIVLCWFLMQVEPTFFLPETWILYQFPVGLLRGMSFLGALGLSSSYLFIYVRALEGHHLKVQKATHAVNQQRVEALELLTKIANNVPGAVYQYRLSAEGVASFPYASLGIHKIYRVSPNQVKDNADDVLKVIHPEDLERVMESIQDSAKSLMSWQCDYRVQFDDHTVEWRRGVAQPQKEQDGSILWHGFIMDITNEKKLESDLQQSQVITIHQSRLASLGEMAGGIAHEINNPLSIISSKATLIQLILNVENPQLDRAKIELGKLIETTFRIASIVKGLLTFARGDKDADFQNIAVEDVLHDVSLLCSEKAKARGIGLEFVSEKSLVVQGRSVQIAQVMMNLINNSMDAVVALSNPWIKVEARLIENGDKVRFSVTDSGLGLNPLQLEKLMQPFFTTKTVGQGTGLGLSISKGLVEKHGGSLNYDNNSKNTRFYFDLKYAESKT